MSEIIKYLYTKFLLRDLLSFVMPGAIIVGTILMIKWDWNFGTALVNAEKILFLLYFPLFGGLYIIGFAVQCFGGELLNLKSWGVKKCEIGIIRFHLYDDDQAHFNKLKNMYIENEEIYLQHHERLVTLKQMCGNCSVAIFISIVLYLYSSYMTNEIPWNIEMSILALLCGIFLYLGHHRHVHRQNKWENVDK